MSRPGRRHTSPTDHAGHLPRIFDDAVTPLGGELAVPGEVATHGASNTIVEQMRDLTTTSGVGNSHQRYRSSSTSLHHSSLDQRHPFQHHQEAQPGSIMPSQFHQGGNSGSGRPSQSYQGGQHGPSMAAGQASRSQRPDHYSNRMWDTHQEVLGRLSRGGGISFGGFPHLHAERAAEEVGRQERQEALELQRRSSDIAGPRSSPSGSTPSTYVIPRSGQNQSVYGSSNCLSCTGLKKCDKKRPCGTCAKAKPPRKCLYPANQISQNDSEIQHLNPLILGQRPICFNCNQKPKKNCNGDKPCSQCEQRLRGSDCAYPLPPLAVPGRASAPCKRCQNSKRSNELRILGVNSKFEPCDQALPACQNCCSLGLEVALDCTYSAQARTEAYRNEHSLPEWLERGQAVDVNQMLAAPGNVMDSFSQMHSGPIQGQQHRIEPRYQGIEAASDFPRVHEVGIIRGPQNPELAITASRPPPPAPKRRQQDRRESSSEKDTPAPEGKRKKK